VFKQPSSEMPAVKQKKYLKMARFDQLKQLDLRTRNKLRAILSTSGSDAGSQIAALRLSLTDSKRQKLDGILSHQAVLKAAKPRALFPQRPQFSDPFFQRQASPLGKILPELCERAQAHKNRLLSLIGDLRRIDLYIANMQFEDASSELLSMIDEAGWSHAALRKAALIRDLSHEEIPSLTGLFSRASPSNNNIVVSSVINCFASEQNYLTTKKSVMLLVDREGQREFVRTLARIPFHPAAHDDYDFAKLLQATLSCSLIDAIILAKYNSPLLDKPTLSQLEVFFQALNLQDGAGLVLSVYDSTDAESEHQFLKHSSAWLESSTVFSFRTLADNLYDAPESSYLNLTHSVEATIDEYIRSPTMEILTTRQELTYADSIELRRLQISGTVTRSAIFNHWIKSENGDIELGKNELLTLMGQTRDLSRTIPIIETRRCVQISTDKHVKLILLLLLARRSRNERDDHELRRVMQDIIISEFDGSLMQFIESFEVAHPEIAEYIYDVATEEFIAKLARLTHNIVDITTTRAALHTWRARQTGESIYADRARTLLIDHQLNRVRNEIDDNRIYVDVSRFSSWINDEVMLDLNSALTTAATTKKGGNAYDEALLSAIISKCYGAFCSSSIFGIASYLGRRIRHGTFRGHLFSSVVNLFERNPKYQALFQNAHFSAAWNRWKNQFDKIVKSIAVDRLHVESRSKPDGMIHGEINEAAKQEIQSAAIRAIINAYTETKTTENLDQVIIEYCWRIVETDLKHVIAFLKGQQSSMKQPALVGELNTAAGPSLVKLNRDFTRDLVHSIDAKLMTMFTWFKKPTNMSPRASLGLLFSAVVSEVRDTFPQFAPDTNYSDLDDIELVGGVYHVLYDCFYVVTYNAAKHGDPAKTVNRRFWITGEGNSKKLWIEVSSGIYDEEQPETIQARLARAMIMDIAQAHDYENRSGIPKLRQLEHSRKEFSLQGLEVKDRRVVAQFSYDLEH
jgi:hypothetical protein